MSIEKITEHKIQENSKSDSDHLPKNKKFTFPWWLKMLLYLFCFACMVASIFFTVIKG